MIKFLKKCKYTRLVAVILAIAAISTGGTVIYKQTLLKRQMKHLSYWGSNIEAKQPIPVHIRIH